MASSTRAALFAGATLAFAVGAYLLLRPKPDAPVAAAASSSPANDEPSSTPKNTPLAAASEAASAVAKNPDGTPVLDRAKADAIRARLKALYGEAPATPETAQNKPNPQYPVMPHDPDRNDVLKDYIHQRIKDDYVPLAKSCYENTLVKHPQLGGRLVMSFRIVGDRRVGGVVDSSEIDPSSTIQDEELSTCMKESMMAVSFDAPPDDKPVTVKYPIELSPGDGGE